MKNNKQPKKKIGIVGSGITGMALAYFLSKKGYDITIIDKTVNSGGLAISTEINGVPIEKFYHHFFTSDTDLIELSKALGIDNKIKVYPSSVGFFINSKLLPFTTPLDLLKFSPIPFLDRIKMGLLTLYFIRKSTWNDLEKYTCEEYFDRLGAQKLYEVVWKPLLRLKFGESEPNIPATFLWGRINPRGRSRKGMGEKLAYFDGSFSVLFEALANKLVSLNVKFVNEFATKITKTGSRVKIATGKTNHLFDKIIFTGSLPQLSKIYSELDELTQDKSSIIKYQAINCMILKLKKKVSPFYWLNIVDDTIPFAGFIEHTNLVPETVYGSHIAYVFNYLPATHHIYNLPPEEVYKLYLKGIRKVFPHFSFHDVIEWKLFRHPFATPIYEGKYSYTIPPIKLTENIFIANTTHVYPEDRNVSNGIALAKKVSKLI